jgi:hypothetical protein
MIEQKINRITRDQEKEIINILIDSSLYLGMSLPDRLDLLHFLVSSYFNILPPENSRARTTAMQTGSAM